MQKLKTLESYSLVEFAKANNASSIGIKKNSFGNVFFAVNGKRVGSVAKNVLEENILSWDKNGNLQQNGALCINKVQGEPTEYCPTGQFYLLSKSLIEDLGSLEVEF